MAFQSVPETAEIAVIFSRDGVIIQNTYHAQWIGGYSEQNLEDMAAVIDTYIGNQWLDDLDTCTTYLRTEVKGLENLNDFLRVDSSSTGPGTVTGSCVPSNVTIAVKKLSAFTGRSARGRIYWPGFATSQVSSSLNQVNAAHQAIILANVEGIRTAIVNQGAVPVIVSRFTGGAQRPEGVTFGWIAVSLEDARVDTQRRRLY